LVAGPIGKANGKDWLGPKPNSSQPFSLMKTMDGGPPGFPLCKACGLPITGGQKPMRVEFQTDRDSVRGLSGDYHSSCGRVFQSLARVMNMNPWSRF